MIIKGNPITKGYSFGKAFILKEQKIKINFNKISSINVKSEILLFYNSLNKTIKQLKKIKSFIKDENKKLLFDGYIILLEDKSLEENIIKCIKNDFCYSDAAVYNVIKKQISIISKVNNFYIKERINDLLDIKKRLIFNIKGINLIDFNFLNNSNKIIIISKDLYPTQIIQFNLKKIVGFIIELGSLTSHTCILAKSLGLIGIIQVKNDINKIKDNDNIIIDGSNGNIYINSNNEVINKFKIKFNTYIFNKNKLKKIKYLNSVTKDGHNIKLLANIANDNDIKNVLKYGADGIGLYRTEFLFMDRNSFPSEQEQFNSYKKIINLIGNKIVTIRTVDLGGDKFLPYMNFPKDDTPFLGWRSIRIYKDKKNILRTQLKAIFRASIYGKIRIMFPMIISMEEVEFLKNEINFVKKYLIKKKIKFDKNIKIGAMIETPSAALIINFLSKEFDFFSIGTNDLTQYTLAVNRNNSMVSYLYDSLSPSIIYLINHIVYNVHKNGKKVCICGELASDEISTKLLLGLGLDELSMNSNSIPKIKYNIRNTNFKDSIKLKSIILNTKSSKEIRKILIKKNN